MRTTIASMTWLLAPALLGAQAQPMAQPMGKKQMTNAEFTAASRAAAPAKIAANATVMRWNPTTKAMEALAAGTNGFTCTYVDDFGAGFCGDANAWQFMMDAMAQKPKPTNTAPGICYMAAGGQHFETASGEIKMTADSTTHLVKEPPHWMVMWPVDASSGIPTKPVPNGTYIMFAGTPYAHLMIYQDPATMMK